MYEQTPDLDRRRRLQWLVLLPLYMGYDSSSSGEYGCRARLQPSCTRGLREAHLRPQRTSRRMIRRQCAVRLAFVGPHHFQRHDNVPVAALGIVSKLPDCVPRRYAFDTLLLGHNVPVASNDEDFGVSHIWKRCIHPNTQKRLWKVLQTQNILAKRKDPIAGNQKTCTATEKQFLESQRNPRNRRNAREHISHADVFIP